MIPEAKSEVVSHALREAFGVSELDDVRMMTAGLSKALVFRIVVRGCPYLLRVILDTGVALGPGQGDQAHHFSCMKLAAEAGIGPRVWYTNVAEGISITDFVEAQPFPRTTALALLPVTLRTLHALPPYPTSRVVKYLSGMCGMVQRFQTAGIVQASEASELFEFFGQAVEVYPDDGSDMAPSHNDAKPENMIFDGARVWLVDWEAAFSNDRYLDLAVVANFVVRNAAEEDAYLASYFGEPVSEYRRARFYLMSQMLHMFYAAFLMLLGAKEKSIDSLATAPDFHEFHDRIWAGGVDLGDEDTKVEYAKAHLSRALQEMRGERFREALRCVSQNA